jgi:hypothetical protein
VSTEAQTSEAGFDQRQETARGRAIYDALLQVHAYIRHDLELVEQLATQAVDGAPTQQIREQLAELKRESIIWRLQVSCLRYCSFVHSHHNAEDRSFFGELRAANPAIDPVVDRLQTEHRRVSDDLDAVEAAADALERDESRAARQAVVETLGVLEKNLLAHLAYEEISIRSTARRLPEL